MAEYISIRQRHVASWEKAVAIQKEIGGNFRRFGGFNLSVPTLCFRGLDRSQFGERRC